MRGVFASSSSSPSDARCRGCGSDVRRLPADAAFCPDCGRRVRAVATAWSKVLAVASRLRRRPTPFVDTGPRAAVVVGYSNALWRLGWRYEHGRGTMRNVPEAIRCYRKSAGLGNVEAMSRLDPSRGEAMAVIPVEADTRDAGNVA